MSRSKKVEKHEDLVKPMTFVNTNYDTEVESLYSDEKNSNYPINNLSNKQSNHESLEKENLKLEKENYSLIKKINTLEEQLNTKTAEFESFKNNQNKSEKHEKEALKKEI